MHTFNLLTPTCLQGTDNDLLPTRQICQLQYVPTVPSGNLQRHPLHSHLVRILPFGYMHAHNGRDNVHSVW